MESDMTNAAASIRRGLQKSLTHAKGHKTGARVHHIEVPEPDVAAIRERSGLSQAEFARSIGVALGTLRGWEQGRVSCSSACLTPCEVVVHTLSGEVRHTPARNLQKFARQGASRPPL